MSPSLWLEKLNTLAPAFVDAAVRGAVVLIIALVLTHLLRRRTAAARHLVWVGAIVVQLLLPLFAMWGPRWQLAIPEQIASVLPVSLPTSAPATNAISDGGPTVGAPSGGVIAPTITERAPTITERAGPSRSLPSSEAKGSGRQEVGSRRQEVSSGRQEGQESLVSGRTILIALWLIGALVVLVRLAVGTTMVAKLARKGARVDDGGWLSLAQRVSGALKIDRPLTLLRGDKLGVPVTWGIVYPVVLLPDDADSWTEERRRFVLVHEMAHVKRFDALTQLAGQLALALFWFDPLVWIANRRMQLEREHACDDYVLRHGTAPSMYAEELLSMVRSLGTPDHRTAQPAFAALAMARRSEFEGRMLSILDPVLDRHPLSKGRTLMSAVAALFLVIPLAALHPYQRSANAVSAHVANVATHADTTKRVKAADDLPESFKISILPSPLLSDSLVLGRRSLSKPVSALAAGAATLDSAAQNMGSEIVTVSGKTPTCDTIRLTGNVTSTSSHTHADDDGDNSVIIDYTTYNGERCLSATIIGRLKYSPNEDDIIDMPFGAHAIFRERTLSSDRELTVTRAADGAIQHLYRFNGRSANYDDDARRWFASYLPKVLMEVGINVGPRVARWRAQGGVNGVLDHIGAMSSSGSKRSHYEALLDGDKLSGDELDKLVRSASENLTASSGDMRAVLTRAIPNARISRQGASAIENAITAMASSGDKTAVLELYGQTGDREMLLSVMRAARTIPSSGDKSRLLQSLASRYLSNSDQSLKDAYFKVLDEIPSSGDMRNTLMIAIPYAAQTPEITRHIIKSSRGVASSGDMSQVLIALVSSGAVNTSELRDKFFSAAAEVPSEGDRGRVLTAAASVIRQ